MQIADISCQGGGQFSAHLSYLSHTVPAINWTGSSQPAEVRSRTGDSQCRQFIENQQVMRVDHYCHLMIISKWRKSLPAHPTPVRDWSPGCCQSPRHRQQQFHTGAKWKICQLHKDECQLPCITFVRPGLPPGWTWWVSSRTLSRGFSQEGSWGTRETLK